MKLVKAQRITRDSFKEFGSYEMLLNPEGPRIGNSPIEFFRDMLTQTLDASNVTSYSVCRINPRPFEINLNERHIHTCEAFLPLDNDVLAHVVPSSPEKPCLEDLKVFYIPKGTLVVMRPGVWHHAPFALNNRPVHVLVALPEACYAKDCGILPVDSHEKISIEL